MGKIIKKELETKLFLIECFYENSGWYYYVQRSTNLVELLEKLKRERLKRKRLKLERIIFKVKGTI